jgi:hypothetical protein
MTFWPEPFARSRCSGPRVVSGRGVPPRHLGRDVGQRGRSVGRLYPVARAGGVGSAGKELAPQASLLTPVEGGGDGHEVGQAEGIATSNGRR